MYISLVLGLIIYCIYLYRNCIIVYIFTLLRLGEIMTQTCVITYVDIATWNSNLKGKKYFAGDITHGIKLCRRTTRRLLH